MGSHQKGPKDAREIRTINLGQIEVKNDTTDKSRKLLENKCLVGRIKGFREGLTSVSEIHKWGIDHWNMFGEVCVKSLNRIWPCLILKILLRTWKL